MTHNEPAPLHSKYIFWMLINDLEQTVYIGYILDLSEDLTYNKFRLYQNKGLLTL